jgi:D-alanine-D-alanine ligase
MGGPSSEREISLKSGKAIYESLKNSGLEAIAIDINTDDIQTTTQLIKSQKIDCAFIALHGRFGEDGQIQEILERNGLVYTGSAVEASRRAMNKVVSHEIFSSHGLSVPRYRALNKNSFSKDDKFFADLGFPLVVKPVTGGSSIGLSLVDSWASLKKAIDLAFSYDESIIVEEYIKGRELTVGILSEEALPVIEIISKNKFFDFQAKYQPGMTDYIVPANLEKEITQQVKQVALLAHQLLGCFGCSRVDIILSTDNVPFILEINTIPGFTSTSLLPKAAKAVGIEFNQLCMKLIDLAYAKTRI